MHRCQAGLNLLIAEGFSTGYDTGVISGALVTIASDLGPAELSSGQKVRKHLEF